MPSACAKVEKQNCLDTQDPLKQVQNLVEKKIRNLEKRKGRLESLQQELQEGKALHDDQKKAIKKFEDVIEMLDFFKEFSKNVNTVFIEHSKVMKKQAKKEQLERQQQEIEKIKLVILFQDLLNGMGAEVARNDFINGRNGAIKLESQQLIQLDELFKIIFPERLSKEVEFEKLLVDCSDSLLSLVEGRSKEAFKGTTFKDLKDLLLSINSSGYFDSKSGGSQKITLNHSGDSKKVESCERIQEKVEPIKNFSVTDQLIASSQPSTMTQFQPPHTEGYSFLQESRLEGTPHTITDPAVVAIAPIQTAYQTSYPVQGSEAMTNPSTTPAISASESANKNNPIPTQTFTNQNFAAIMGTPTFVPTVPLSTHTAMSLGMQMQQISPPNQDVMSMQSQNQHVKPGDQSNQILSQQFQQQQIQSEQGFAEYHMDNRNVQGLTSQDKPYYHEEGNVQGSNFRGGYRRGRGSRAGSVNGYGRGGGGRGGRGYQGNYSNYGTNGQSNDKKGVHLSNQVGGRGGGGGMNRGRGASNRNSGITYGHK